jgi:hypothetical protein
LVAKLTEAEIRRRVDAVNSHPTIRAAAKSLGMGASTLAHTMESLRSTGRVLDGTVQPPAPEELRDAIEVAVPTPTEVRDANFWRNKAKAAEDRAAESEHILREMAGIFERPLSLPEWTLPSNGEMGRAVGLIHLSDLHCGEVVRLEEAAGINEYNPDVFRRRLRRMIDASIRILPRWSSDCELKGVVVALNGDLISGDIHAELRETNALTSHEQVALATDELAAGIRKLADQFDAVLVTVTPGNHGRSTEKTHAKRMAALSYDVMIGNILAREFANDARVTVNTASGADIVFPLFGWSVLQTHGDSMGTGGGQGFAGPELPIVRGGKKIKLSGFATGERYDIILVGHYHTSSNPGAVLANGSMIGFNEYAVRIRATPEPPQQWLALIHERWGLRERVPVVLEDPEPPRRPRIRIPAGMSAAA